MFTKNLAKTAGKTQGRYKLPVDFKKIMENKPLFYGIIAGIVILLRIVIIVGVAASSNNNSKPGVVKEKIIKEPYDLFTTDKIGQALEVQALLARQGIKAQRRVDGTKSTLYLAEYTQDQKDRALLAIVRSGIVDQHIGLEIFDNGDFTSTKEDKRIRLARAINGELARLIRKLDTVENAQVFISIPEQSLFASKQKPVTATVQVQLEAGKTLDNMKVKTITNLLLGAVQDLEPENISITDTDGNVYNSIIGGANDALTKLQENDKYMQQKVAAQLDRLVGKGNYVVTVSTFLTQAPVEKTSIIYDPSSKTAVNEQNFSEKLGDVSSDSNSATNAVSVYLPYGVPGSGANSSQDRKYIRSANETQYGVSKTQINEYMKEGVIEQISIAVSLEQSSIPMSMTIQEMKELIANAASPLVDPENVSIAFVESTTPILAPDSPNHLPKPEESGNPWWVVGLFLLIGLGFGLKHIAQKVRSEAERQEEELELLRKKSEEQEKQLKVVNMKAAELIQKQAQMAQNLIEQQNLQMIQAQAAAQAAAMAANAQQPVQQAPRKEKPVDIKDELRDLSMDFSDLDENLAVEKLKNWIETN